MMRRFTLLLLLSITLLSLDVPVHAQVGSGPAPPATAQPDRYGNLTWVASTSCTVASPCTYNVYRGTVAGGAKGRINPAPISSTAFRDATGSTPPPAFGVLNFYTVTAVRTSDGVESAQSTPEVSATAVQGSPAAPTGVNIVLAILLDIVKGIEYAGKFVIHFLA